MIKPQFMIHYLIMTLIYFITNNAAVNALNGSLCSHVPEFLKNYTCIGDYEGVRVCARLTVLVSGELF